MVKGLLKNKLSPQWHYIIWIVLILKLLIPFGPESSISIFNIIPQYSNFQIHNIQQSPVVQPLPVFYNRDISVNTNLENELSVRPLQEIKIVEGTINSKHLLSYGYFSVVLLITLWVILSYYTLHKNIKKSTFAADENIYCLLEDSKKYMGIKRDISLLIQDAITTPSIYGIIKPKIILTPDISKLSEKEIRYILLHELGHYKRKDMLVNELLIILQIIHWFNPVIWYCIKQIRLDMEVATDSLVLSNLESVEYKDYGRTLLSMLQRVAKQKNTPSLIGMADERRSMERRIKMIKKTDFFKRNRNITILIGIICVLVLGGTFLTSGISRRNGDYIDLPQTEMYNANELFKFKSQYIGDQVNISNLLNNLPFGDVKEGISLATKNRPYSITVKYNFTNEDINIMEVEDIFYNNALIIFVLIENVDEVIFEIDEDMESREYKYSRADIQDNFKDNIDYYSNSLEDFKLFVNASIRTSKNGHRSLDEAISQAIKARGQFYYGGEFATSGHIIIGTEEIEDKIKVYALTSVGGFGFENGVFTKISGSGSIPTAMTFKVTESGEYILLEYRQPEDGGNYAPSLRKMVPEKYYDIMLSSNNEYINLKKQEEAQAREYLKSIGREAEVSADYVKKELSSINVQASNKLFSELTKYDEFLNNCPYWLGTRELVEDGVRYIYETAQIKTREGKDLITFRKTKDDGTLIEERRFLIDGSEPRLVE